ncbi:hypothetical protein [Kitasatospora sp. LaBMicrA B282]|uniref:hypothetical protein n=1 Tax=Kitasatospora sp. LaBMicrA B282 TaxID=3420949 RepID=UPI003D0B7A1A
MRMMIRDVSRGSQGITEGGDLKVSALTTPGPAVRVGPGSAVIRGAAWGQGSCTQANAGDSVEPIVPTGAQERIDLIVLRIEDPEYEGNRDPDKDDIGYIHASPMCPAGLSPSCWPGSGCRRTARPSPST